MKSWVPLFARLDSAAFAAYMAGLRASHRNSMLDRARDLTEPNQRASCVRYARQHHREYLHYVRNALAQGGGL